MHVLYIYYNFTFIFHFSRNKFNVEARASIVATLLVLIVCIPRLYIEDTELFSLDVHLGDGLRFFLGSWCVPIYIKEMVLLRVKSRKTINYRATLRSGHMTTRGK